MIGKARELDKKLRIRVGDRVDGHSKNGVAEHVEEPAGPDPPGPPQDDRPHAP